MAHAIDRLALLYPYPDAVRGFALHKTLKSSRLTARSQPYDKPRGTISLAVADCKFRAPLSPRSAQCNHFTPNFKKKQGFYVSNKKIIVENRPRGFAPRNSRIKILVKNLPKASKSFTLLKIFVIIYIIFTVREVFVFPRVRRKPCRGLPENCKREKRIRRSYV